MFREYLEKGKVWVDKIAAAVMNYTELENKVREATSDEPWGPHGTILNDLAKETYDTEGLLEIMTMLMTRIFPENSENWRRIHKGLVVLAYLLRNGSENVCEIARDHLFNLRSLENYQCIDLRGRDLGSSVRIKAHEVVELIQDNEFLQAERNKALSNQKVYAGIGSNHFRSSNYSGNFGMSDLGNNPDHLDRENFCRLPSHSTPQAEMPWLHTEKSHESNTIASNRLGSFDSWKDAHERTIADDVADKFSEVLRAAKAVTNDFLGRPRVPPPSIFEEDPHKVSEETFTFPDVEVDQSEDMHNSYRSTLPTNLPSTVRHEKPSPAPAPASLIEFDPPSKESTITTPTRLPRPPSTEMLAPPPKNGQIEKEVDFFAELDKLQVTSSANVTNAATESTDMPATASTVSTTAVSSDADFGDFSSFHTAFGAESSVKSTAAAKPVLPATRPVDPFFDGYTLPSSPTAHAFGQAPMTPTSPSSIISRQQQNSVLASPSASNHQTCNQTKTASSNFGNTWKDLDAFNLDLDFKTVKSNPVKPVAPSLSQLQSLKRTPTVTQQMTAQNTSRGTGRGASTPTHP